MLRIALFALLASLPATALAGKNKVRHTNVVSPQEARAAVDLSGTIGRITNVDLGGDTIYVAGQTGIAAVSTSGEVRWTVDLPLATLRNVDADESGVAFSAYSLVDVDPAGGFTRVIMGQIGDVPEWNGHTIGYVSDAGEVAWTVEGAATSAMSPPALAPAAIGVNYGKLFVAYDRADGRELGRSEIDMVGENMKLLQGFYAHSTRARPVFHDGHFYSGYLNWLVKSAPDGTEVDKAIGKFPISYANITCGPLVWNDSIVIGNAETPDRRSQVFAVGTEPLKNAWRAPIEDTSSGCGQLAAHGDVLVAATNFHVWAMNAKGKMQWLSVNKKGGLYPSSARGVRYLKNKWGASYPVVKSYGDFLQVDGSRVYVTSARADDVITVLDLKDGRYVETLEVHAPIIDTALLPGGGLLVATDAGLRFFPAGG